MELTFHEAGQDVVVATRPGLLVTAWGGAIQKEKIQRMDGVIRRLVEVSEGGRYSSITIVEPTISMRFEEDARETSMRLQKRWAPHIRALAYLVEGMGFLPAAVRTLTAGLHLVTRAPYPLKVFRDAGELSGWVASEDGPPSAVVIDAVDRARLKLAR